MEVSEPYFAEKRPGRATWPRTKTHPGYPCALSLEVGLTWQRRPKELACPAVGSVPRQLEPLLCFISLRRGRREHTYLLWTGVPPINPSSKSTTSRSQACEMQIQSRGILGRMFNSRTRTTGKLLSQSRIIPVNAHVDLQISGVTYVFAG